MRGLKTFTFFLLFLFLLNFTNAFNFDIYETGAEWLVLNWTAVNESALNVSSCNAVEKNITAQAFYMVPFERGTVVSNGAFAIGNGQTPYGYVTGHDGTVTLITGTCSGVGTTLDLVLRKNNTATSCDVDLVATNNKVAIDDCNVDFGAHDILGVYAGTEVGAWTECVGAIKVEYDFNIMANTLESGLFEPISFYDLTDATTIDDYLPKLEIGSCNKGGITYITWPIQFIDYASNDIDNVSKIECWLSDTAYGEASNNCYPQDAGSPYDLLYVTNSGSKYYGHYKSDDNGVFSVGFLGFDGGDVRDCWLMCTMDGYVYISETCEDCPLGVLP